MRLTTSGTARNFDKPIIGRITSKELPADFRNDSIFYLSGESSLLPELPGYRALISHFDVQCTWPVVDKIRPGLPFSDGDVIAIEPDGFIRSLYRPHEKHHSLFATERCSSNCLMCSQPPKDVEDIPALTDRNRELIRLMDPAPQYLTITGGEPTLLGQRFFDLLLHAKRLLPSTAIHVLTNGRTLAWPEICRRIAEIQHPDLSFGVPLYSDFAGDHDYVVQARGAFDQTISGLHQAARHGLRLEVRIVLHALTIPRLQRLSEFIYRNLPMVEHVAFMGLEFVGYTARNIEELWIDPYDYRAELRRAVEFLALRDMNISIYNHQLCVLDPALWRFAKKSISDWKNQYFTECESCKERESCGGFFQWAVKKHSAHIRSIAS